jgi:hypothetical protein
VRRVFALVLGALWGCGPSLQLEAGGTAAVEPRFRVEAPLAPAAPASPKLTPCPAGWREEAGDVSTCEPWPETGRAACAGESVHLPGTPGCAPLVACPSDGWPAELPAGRTIVYVRAGAAGGTGTRAQPFGTLQQAVSGSGAGKVIALAPGVYEASTQPLPANTVVVGTCPGRTTLTLSAANPSPATVLSNAAGVELHQVTVTGTGVGVAAAGPSARLLVKDVLIDGVEAVGLRVEGLAQVTGQRVVVRGTVPRADGMLGVGIQVVDGSQLELREVVITDSASVGVFVFGANARVSLSQAAIVANRGTGAWANQGSSLTLSASVVEDNQETGVFSATGSLVELTDVVARRTAVTRAGTGQNVWVDGARLRANRLRLEDATALGLGAQNASVVEVEDFVAQRDYGVGANAGARLVLTRALMRQTTGIAFNSRLPGTMVDLVDATVTDPATGPGVMSGSGVSVIRGGALSATRLLVRKARGIAVLAQGAGGRLSLTDALIDDTLPGSDGEAGFPLTVVLGASLTADRVRLQGGFTAGFYVSEPGSTATVTDFEVQGIQPPASQGGLYGNGVVVAMGARLSGQRVRIADVHDTGLLADSAGSSATLTDVTIVGTALRCTGCDARVAVGVSAQEAASVSLSRFSLGSNGGIGAQVADSAQLDLTDGWIGFHQLGVNVMPAAYDLGRVDRNVTYARNGQKVAAQMLPLPKVPPPPRP